MTQKRYRDLFYKHKDNIKMSPRSLFFGSFVAEELGDEESELIWSLLEIRNYQSGEIIATPCDTESDSLFLLISGCIEVRMQSAEGLHSIQTLNPGDLANVIAFCGGAIAGICTTLHAVGATQAASLKRKTFEDLLYVDSFVVYRFSRGIVRYVYNVMRHLNSNLIELNEQIHCDGIYCQLHQHRTSLNAEHA
jgi:CRP-like cAMP-binding protein